MASEEMRVLKMLIDEIEALKVGLDPNILAGWYNKIESDAKSKAPRELMDSIQVVQDPILPMKFEFRTSRRVVNCVLESIDDNLNDMPAATRLYFQKLSEIIQYEMLK